MDTLLQDIRYGFRTIVKAPGFALIATLTLALGIGANTALFSVVNGVLLNPLPYAQPDRLVAVYTHSREFRRSSISYPNFLDWVQAQRSFTGLAAFREDDFTLTGTGEPERLSVEMVSANFFPLLGVKPVIGRQFRPDEDIVGAQPVVLISGGLWARKFASSPSVLGRTLVLDGIGYTVVGVIPRDFQYQSGNFHQSTDLFVPIGQWNDPTFRRRDTGMGMDAVGRLKPGVTLAQAQSAMDAIAAHLAQAYPDADKDSGITLIPLKQDVVGEIRPFLLVLLAAVGFVLLIACVNVANLLLARSTGRTREFAIRAALGASRGRVVRQLLTESVLLASAGGVLGVLLAAWGTHAALGLLPEALPRTQDVHTDARVLLFSLGATLLAGLLFGLAPALKTSGADVQNALKEGGRGGSGVRHRTQTVLVIAEVALALVLLVGAGLMIRTLTRLWSVNPGFDPHGVVTFAVSLPVGAGATADSVRASMRQLESTIAGVPGVEAASLRIGANPMAGDSEFPFWIEGQPRPSTEAEMKSALFYGVSPSYLKAMGLTLERGRFLAPQDDERAPFVVDIDDQFAKLYFAGQNPIGQHVHFTILDQTATIVGVVGHVKQWGLDEKATSPVLAQFYFPVMQMPDKFMPLLASGLGVTVRTHGSAEAAIGAIRRAVDGLGGQIVMYNVSTMDAIISRSLAARRFSMLLLGVFATLALILASVGLYGVISYLVGQRTHEIGIRLALGAQKRDILQLILGQGTRMALIGVGVGLVGSLGLMRLMGTFLYGVSASDPLTFGAVALLLILVAVAACYLPARRAMRVDQMVALRYE
ncbi:MAG: ABC transporter permease [Acidobacteriota bacterium]|nr:ABC transporter permease [Acidobacteriota bacterium]